MDGNKNGRGTARSTSWATASAYEKQNDGEPGQTAGRSSCHVPDCIRFATWNIGTMSGRSAEVVETLILE